MTSLSYGSAHLMLHHWYVELPFYICMCQLLSKETLVFSSLRNIFSSPEGTARSSSAGLLSNTVSASKDPWRTFARPEIFESVSRLEACIDHLALISKAGVACPLEICMQVASNLSRHSISTLHRQRLAEIMLRLAFSRTASVTKVQEVVAQINMHVISDEGGSTSSTACVDLWPALFELITVTFQSEAPLFVVGSHSCACWLRRFLDCRVWFAAAIRCSSFWQV